MQRAATAILLLCAILLGAAACTPHAPADPGLASEDFGSGVRLGMDVAAARAAASSASGGIKFEAVSYDDFANRNAYRDRPQGQDLLIGLYYQEFATSTGVGGVNELRCYLAPLAQSQATLLGKPLAPMKPADAIALLGPPANRADSNDGLTHLTYRFQRKDKGRPDLSLVLSFDLAGHCFAAQLSQVQDIK